ncbi:MAG: shikimate kinase [Candidatus Margulisiibacteriota bacterium]
MVITLIGMPGVGKTELGKRLAKLMDYGFIDPDQLIRQRTHQDLIDIIDRSGTDAMMRIEEETILNLTHLARMVLAPGGSVVYSQKAMRHLKKQSIIVYLQDSFENIQRRVTDAAKRGIVGLKEKGFEAVFAERQPLYEKYADHVFRLEGDFDPDAWAQQLFQFLKDHYEFTP